MKILFTEGKKYIGKLTGIGIRMSVYFLVLLFVIIGICMALSQYVYRHSQEQKMYETSKQAVDSILAGIHSRISTADSYSKMIIYNPQVQEELRNVTPENYMDLYVNPQSFINGTISQVLQTSSFSSIYLYSMEGLCFSGYLSSAARLDSIDIMQMPWYQQVMDANGGAVIQLNAAGAPSSKTFSNYLSLIRCVLNLNDFQPIGVMIINIPESDLKKEMEEILMPGNAFIKICDAQGNCLTNLTARDAETLSDSVLSANEHTPICWNGRDYFYFQTYYEKYGWSLEYFIPVSKTGNLLSLLTKSYFILFAGAIIMVCIGTFLISRSITLPLKQLLFSMNQVQDSDFVKVSLPTRKDEIYYLIQGYNRMIDQIDTLINQIIKQESDKRKYELQVLQSQIKPHFLYNTFDTISYLALSAGNQELFSLISALGNYYRTSLSRGSEIITLEKELEIVKDYLFILSYRYPNLFQCEYEAENSLLHYPILRLSLQPFVENAVYHGLKPKGSSGTIAISLTDSEHEILIQIRDDGVGMDQQKIDTILNAGDSTARYSFGIYGTIQRLRLYYNTDNICQITASPGCGTTITLHIPKNNLF